MRESGTIDLFAVQYAAYRPINRNILELSFISLYTTIPSTRFVLLPCNKVVQECGPSLEAG